MTQQHSDRHLWLIDTGRSESLTQVRYEDLMRALGSYVDEHGLTEVLISQIPDGILLKGTMIDKSRANPVEKITATLFTNDDVVLLLKKSAKRRGTGRLRPPRWPNV
ncbi:MAG TPA: hypothetical protein VMM78_02665 [Thermomicrobiales bacterium]|nr:hypothetical protein [Thermomicrobiales bacterium]